MADPQSTSGWKAKKNSDIHTHDRHCMDSLTSDLTMVLVPAGGLFFHEINHGGLVPNTFLEVVPPFIGQLKK
jgi:hypothetical protein